MTKNKTFLALGILTLMLMSLAISDNSFPVVSATQTIIPSQIVGSVEQGSSFTTTFIISNNNPSSNFSEISGLISSLMSGSNLISDTLQSLSGVPSILTQTSNSSAITYSVNVPTNQATGVYTGNITISGKSHTTPVSHIVPVTITVNQRTPQVANFCEFGTVGDLEISDFNVDNLGNGKDDDWEPLDEIEIEVEIENTDNNDDVDDVMVEIKIEDENGDDITSDFDFEDEEIDLGRIRDDDQEIATFKINEVPADLDEGEYRIFIKAYSDGDEDLQCVDESGDLNQDIYHAVDFTREEDVAVVVRDDDLRENILISCGDEDVEVTFPIYNIGVDKEDKVLVNLYSPELGIDEFEVVDNLRSGKRKEVSFFVDIPQELSKDRYNLEVITFYEYDDGDELEEFSYDSNSKDDLSDDFRFRLEVLACRFPEPIIGADLESEAVEGEELSVRFTITNTGNAADFVFAAEGYESWAELLSITPQVQNLGEGETTQVLVRLNPTTSGPQSFKLTSIADSTNFDQEVSVNIQEKGGFSFENNLVFYLVIGIAILILLIFITVLIRGSSSSDE